MLFALYPAGSSRDLSQGLWIYRHGATRWGKTQFDVPSIVYTVHTAGIAIFSGQTRVRGHPPRWTHRDLWIAGCGTAFGAGPASQPKTGILWPYRDFENRSHGVVECGIWNLGQPRYLTFVWVKFGMGYIRRSDETASLRNAHYQPAWAHGCSRSGYPALAWRRFFGYKCTNRSGNLFTKYRWFCCWLANKCRVIGASTAIGHNRCRKCCSVDHSETKKWINN